MPRRIISARSQPRPTDALAHHPLGSRPVVPATAPDLRRFLRAIEGELAELAALPPDAASHVMVVGLGNLHQIRQTLGASLTAELLAECGERIADVLNENDLLADAADGTFLILLRRYTNRRTMGLVERMHRSLSEPFAIGGRVATAVSHSGSRAIVASVGAEDLLADAALAADDIARQRGQGHRYFQHELEQDARRWQEIDGALRHAIEAGELGLVYQPQFSIRSRAVTGLEALARWDHPTLGSVPPEEFVRIAEETGYIVTLGAWVLQEACTAAARWIHQDLLHGRLAVNVSPVQIQDPGFVKLVLQALRVSGLPASRLELELTEQAFVGDTTQLRQTMETLTELGVTFALDDFGTGYSSLKYLAELPFRTLKVDRYFVARAARDHSVRAIVSAMAATALALKMQIVAEGIEEESEVHLLRRLSVHEGQGFLFSKPLDAPAVEGLLRDAAEPQPAGGVVLPIARS
jgi:EAL domain-containing protein (putative c-di-GMP-specific phosphodiesterase class I)/GGDEF domain-containing protein